MSSLPKKLHRRNVAGIHDPWRRLAAAVVLQAIMDFLYPNPSTPFYARSSAQEFCQSQSGRDLIEELAGISPAKIKELIG